MINLNIVTHSDVVHLDAPQRFFEYAYAYLDAAFTLCEKAISDDSYTWSNASVILLLAAHATELFLKGAILYRDSAAKIYSTHTINELSEKYKKLYPEPLFQWDIPFNSEYQGLAEYLGITETELRALKKTEPVPSIFYRYPVDKDCKEWKGTFGFEPHSFLELLEHVKNNFDRIKSQIT